MKGIGKGGVPRSKPNRDSALRGNLKCLIRWAWLHMDPPPSFLGGPGPSPEAHNGQPSKVLKSKGCGYSVTSNLER